MSSKKQLLSIIFVFLLSGCMGVKFTYNNLDWMLPWYLDDYLILNDTQEAEFEKRLDLLWLWHRQNELPQYSAVLKEIVADLDEEKITHERLHYYSEKSQVFFQTVATEVLTEGVDLIATLSDEQLIEMYEALEANDKEYQEYVEETSLEERIKERNKSVRKTFRKWIGKLSKKQERLIDEWSKETITTLEHRLAYIPLARKAFKNAMVERNNTELTLVTLTRLATQPELLRSKEYNDIDMKNRLRFRQLILDTLPTLSQKQKLRLRNRITNYAEDFSELSKET